MKIKKINALTHIITFIPSMIVMPIDIAMYLMKERSKFNHKMHKSELLSREYKYIWINKKIRNYISDKLRNISDKKYNHKFNSKFNNKFNNKYSNRKIPIITVPPLQDEIIDEPEEEKDIIVI